MLHLSCRCHFYVDKGEPINWSIFVILRYQAWSVRVSAEVNSSVVWFVSSQWIRSGLCIRRHGWTPPWSALSAHNRSDWSMPSSMPNGMFVLEISIACHWNQFLNLRRARLVAWCTCEIILSQTMLNQSLRVAKQGLKSSAQVSAGSSSSSAGTASSLNFVPRRYNQIADRIQMSGPTNFGPVIRKAVEIVKETQQFHVLVIIADGQVDRRQDTIDAIVEASKYPLSIVCVGVVRAWLMTSSPFQQLASLPWFLDTESICVNLSMSYLLT